MNRFETESLALLPGQRVQARILRHEPWGVLAQIIGHEHIGGSIDLIEQFGALRDRELEVMYPPVGTVIDAVVEQVRRGNPSAWVRLSIRPRDLQLFRWPCGFCREPVTLSPGGGGLVLDVRSNDGPAATPSSPTLSALPTDCILTRQERGPGLSRSARRRKRDPRRADERGD